MGFGSGVTAMFKEASATVQSAPHLDMSAATVGASATSEAIAGPESVMSSLTDSLSSMFTGKAAGVDAANSPNAPQQAQGLNIKNTTWKAQTALDNNKVAKGVETSNKSAAAMGQDANQKLGHIAAFEKSQKGADAGMSANGPSAEAQGGLTGLLGMGGGMALDAVTLGAVGFAAGPAAAAALGGVMMARDALKMAAGGISSHMGSDPRMMNAPSPKTVTLKGAEAKAFKNTGYVPAELKTLGADLTNSFERQARQMEAGYNSGQKLLDKLSAGPGFGGRAQLAGNFLQDRDSRFGVSASESSMAMNGEVKKLKADLTAQRDTAKDLQQGLDARANNGVKVGTAGEMEGMDQRLAHLAANRNAGLVMGNIA